MMRKNHLYRRTPSGIGVQLQPAGVNMGANYTLTFATEEIMARILEWFARGRPFEWYLNVIRNPSPQQRKIIATAVRYAPAHLLEHTRQERKHNLVPALLRNSLATLISGSAITPTLMANYIALGDGTAAPANSDTILGNETLRAEFDDRTAENHIAILNKFFTAAHVGGNTYQEAGIFVDGTGSADTGYLLSRILLEISPAATETLAINATISINAA